MTQEFKIFLEWYKNIAKFNLLESPQLQFVYDKKYLDDNLYNFECAKETLKDTSFKRVVSLRVVNVDCALYSKVEQEVYYDNWLISTPKIVAQFVYRKIGDGVKFGSVWNSTDYYGTARLLFFQYYIKQFSFLQSDNIHSQYGKIYWQKLINQALTEGYRVTIFNVATNEEQEYNESNGYRVEVIDKSINKSCEFLTMTSDEYLADYASDTNLTFRIYSKEKK